MLKVEMHSPGHHVSIDIHRTRSDAHYIDAMTLNGYPLTMNYDVMGQDSYGGLTANEQTILVLDAVTQYPHLTSEVCTQFVHTTGNHRRSAYIKLQLPTYDKDSELGAMAIERVVMSDAITYDATVDDLCIVSPNCALLPNPSEWEETVLYAEHFIRPECWPRLAEVQCIGREYVRSQFLDFKKRTHFMSPANVALRFLLFEKNYWTDETRPERSLSIVH